MAGGGADTTLDYGHPIYFSEFDDPIFTVQCVEPWGRCEAEGMQVRIPDEARPAGGTDAHLSVIDQASGWEYDFWQVHSKPAGGGTLRVGSGGRTRIDGDGLAGGATASSFGLAAGVIRPVELAAGEINHALFITVKCTNGKAVAPSTDNPGRICSDIGLPNANAPSMGQHFYLEMSEPEIAALENPEWQKTILRAMTRYGMFVGDTGGPGFGLMLESGSSYTSFGQRDPWVELGATLGLPKWRDPSTDRTLRIFDMRDAVDWGSALRVSG